MNYSFFSGEGRGGVGRASAIITSLESCLLRLHFIPRSSVNHTKKSSRIKSVNWQEYNEEVVYSNHFNTIFIAPTKVLSMILPVIAFSLLSYCVVFPLYAYIECYGWTVQINHIEILDGIKVVRYSFFGTISHFFNQLLSCLVLVRSTQNVSQLLGFDWSLLKSIVRFNRYYHDNDN